MNHKDLRNIIKEIKRYQQIRAFLIFICYSFLVFAFIFYIFEFLQQRNIVQIVRNANSVINNEKNISKPWINFEYEPNKILFIKADSALYKNDNEIILQNVFAKGDVGEISSGNLFIANEGKDLTFSENPVLIINQYQQ